KLVSCSTGVVPRASGRFVSLCDRFADNAAVIAQLLFELFFELLHLLLYIARGIEIPMPVVVSPRGTTTSLRHFFFGKLGGKFLFLSLAQDSEGHLGSFGKGLQQLSQLARFNQNLVVQHFEDVILLNASSCSRAVRLHV